MKRDLWPMRDSVKDYFPLPKEIFSAGSERGGNRDLRLPVVFDC